MLENRLADCELQIVYLACDCLTFRSSRVCKARLQVWHVGSRSMLDWRKNQKQVVAGISDVVAKLLEAAQKRIEQINFATMVNSGESFDNLHTTSRICRSLQTANFQPCPSGPRTVRTSGKYFVLLNLFPQAFVLRRG